MRPGILILSSATALMPLAVEVPRDSMSDAGGNVTTVRIAGGTGMYAFVARGCEGQVIDEVPVRYDDAAIQLDQRFTDSPFGIGVRAGVVTDRIGHGESAPFTGVPQGETITNRYVNPYFTIAPPGEPFAFGAGPIAREHPFMTADETARTQPPSGVNDVSFHIRLGYEDEMHLLVQWMESMPLYSGGGYLTAMVGRESESGRSRLHFGLSAGGPYEGAGVGARFDFAVVDRLRVGVQGRAAPGGRSGSSGVSLALEYSVVH